MKTIALDFDGVIHSYVSGWTGPIPTDPPVEGAREAIYQLRKKYRVVVYSTRCATPQGIAAINNYLRAYNIEVDDIEQHKPKASLMIDDRGFRFKGNWEEVLNFCSDSKNLDPWYK